MFTRALFFVLATGMIAPAVPAQTAVRLDPVRVVDPAAGTVSEPGSVARVDGRIVEADDPEDRATQVIDTEGRWLIPGLDEPHAHVPPVAHEQQLDDVRTLVLAHGVTIIAGMLGERDHLALRAALAADARFGPRPVTSGPSLNGTSVLDPATARRVLRAQAEAGYDLLMLHSGLLPGSVAAWTQAGRDLGIPSAGHVPIGVDLDVHLDAVAARIRPDDAPD